MTTSGQSGYTLTTTELIHEAFDLCGIAVEGEDLTQAEYERALRSLNLMMRNWQSLGINLWTYNEGTVFLEKGRSSYPLNTLTTDLFSLPGATRAVDTDKYATTELTSDVTSGSSIFTIAEESIVDDQGVTHTLNLDYDIGFLLSDGTIFWTFVVDTDEIFGTFPEDISSGTLVFWTGSRLQSVERVLDVRRIEATTSGNENEVPIQFEAHKDFMALPNKNSTGTVNEATYQRALPSGVMHVWQVPDRETQLLRITYERKIQNFVNTDDDPDIPGHFMNAVVWNLALALSTKFHLSMDDRAVIRQTADEELQQALSFGDANYDMKVSLNRNSRS